MISYTQMSFQETLRLNLNYSQAHMPFSKLQFRTNGCCNFMTNSKCLSRVRVVVNAGYTKTPMETPGAYRLVDEETGQKVIVWGDDDEDAPIPARNVLGWEPPDDGEDYSDGENEESRKASRHAISSTARGGNFGRLKTLRLKDVPRKTFTTKQETGKHVGNQFVSGSSRDGSTVSQRQHEYVGKKKNVDLEQKGNVSQAVKEVIRRTRIERYEGNVDTPTRSSSKQLQEDQITSRKGSAGSVRGWGKGGPTFESGTEFFDAPVRKKSSEGKEFFSRKSFIDIGCKDYMIDSLRSQQFQRPSNIQAMAFRPVVEGKSSIIADQSGSGKTLAYLIPVIQRIRDEELQSLSKSSAQSPRVIVLVPTAELASQVLSNCRSLSKYGVPFRSMVATGGFRQKTQLESLQQELDVLIATPGRFMYLIKEGFLQLTNIRCAVLDEVDILFNDEDFEIALRSLIGSSPVTTQYLFVTATLPLDIYNKLVETFPDCEVIIGPGMHRTSTGLEEVLVDCSGDYGSEKTPDTAFLNKKTALLQLVDKYPVSKTIIFCNKIETCRKVENTLNRLDRKGVRSWVLPFHAAVTQEARLASMKEFLKPRTGRDSLFLVCTDRASRGIDFAGVDHVVLFDFPRDPSEYVRRVGRTARGVGGKGKAFIFVVGKQVSLAQRIVDRNQKGHPLHDVPSSF